MGKNGYSLFTPAISGQFNKSIAAKIAAVSTDKIVSLIFSSSKPKKQEQKF